ncbi:MAG TPA: hypothetical protein VK920_00095 [Solirubrobacterales bacterium]|nr:hypothetical protein [Solirubrobacterales bacterium]
MAARRLLTLLLLLLVVSTLAATLVPPQDEREGTTSSIERSGEGDRAERGAPAPKQLTRTIDATPDIERIELRLGDQLALTVRSGTADQVEIPALGQLEDVDPDAPARFDLLPQRPGAFEVRLLDARRTVAKITVRRR